MASSSLQSTLVTLIVLFLGGCINRRKYLLSSSETGLHLSKNDNLGLDIAIFDKRTLTPLNEKYFNIPPKIVIEVDVKVDISLADFPAKEMDYIFDKSQKLLDSGVEKVVWVTTHTKKIFIASKTQTWIVIDWFTDFELIEGYTLNIKQILDNEEIDY
jgi:Uma2 family endonuclease